MIGDVPVALIKPLVVSARAQLVIVLTAPISLRDNDIALIGVLDLLSKARALALIVALLVAVRAANGSVV